MCMLQQHQQRTSRRGAIKITTVMDDPTRHHRLLLCLLRECDGESPSENTRNLIKKMLTWPEISAKL